MLDKTQLAALIPHSGSMCLLDCVEAWTPEWIRCSTLTHRDLSNPLRLGHELNALHLVEYAAQAMAIHGALLAQSGRQAGMLGALRDIRLFVARLDDLRLPLVITATRRLARTDGLIYDFAVELHDTVAHETSPRTLCEGRVTVVLQASD